MVHSTPATRTPRDDRPRVVRRTVALAVVRRTVALALAVATVATVATVVVAVAAVTTGLARRSEGATVDDPPRDRAAAASSAREESDWNELAAITEAWRRDAPEDPLACAYAALAAAGLGEFEAAADHLRRLDALVPSIDRTLRGFGVPSSVVVDAMYAHAWANWEPAFNRTCWGPFFEAFPDSPNALVPASRLLMAALAERDEDTARELGAWFDARMGSREAPEPGRPRAAYFRAQAWARAGRTGEGPLAWATEAWEHARRAATGANSAERGDAERADDGGEPDFETLEKIDLATDDERNLLALVCAQNARFDPQDNPLAAEEAEPDVVFEDVTKAVGLEGVRASRIAVGDVDGDGDPDLCFSGRLFRNDEAEGAAGRDGERRFVDVTEAAGIAHRGSSALFGDFDDDGDLDLLLPARKPKLLRNDSPPARRRRSGDLRFVDATSDSGLDAVTLGAAPEGATWLDFDGDGHLDVYLAAYEAPMSRGHADVLLRNRGDGTFEDVTAASGVAIEPALCGRGVTTGDYDDDGDPDLYVSNYRLNPNCLFRNDAIHAPTGSGAAEAVPAFVRVDETLGVRGDRQPPDGSWFGHTIGSCFGDVDGDGDLDLFTANLAHPRFVARGFSNLSMLYVNRGAGASPRFLDERRERGVRFQETHSDPAFVDFDQDGDLDLSITCVYEGVPSALYRNDGHGRFAPVTFRSRAVAFHAWGQAWFDLEGDGDLDLLAASSGGVRLLRNGGNDRHWLQVRLLGKRTNRFGVGARVTVETTGEEPRRLVRELVAARGTTSQDGEILHFGLGDDGGRVRLTVRWPDTGQEETQTVAVDRRVTVKQVRTVRAR